jgi:hypothetical protein
MKEIFEKMSSYNIFNYLLPGILFAVFAEKLIGLRIMQADIIVTLFLCYFIGLCISRIGSLILEPILKKISFVKFAPYTDYIRVAKTDPKLEILSESNNMYRTLCSLFIVLLLVMACDAAARRLQLPQNIAILGLIIILCLLFAWSYRKQTKYIADRIARRKE